MELPGNDDEKPTLELEFTKDEDPAWDEDCASDDEGGANDEDSGAELEATMTDDDEPGAEDGGALLLSGPDDVIPMLEDPPDAPMEELPGCELDIPTDDETRLDAVELLDTPRLLPPSDVLPAPLEEDPVAVPAPHTPSWPHT